MLSLAVRSPRFFSDAWAIHTMQIDCHTMRLDCHMMQFKAIILQFDAIRLPYDAIKLPYDTIRLPYDTIGLPYDAIRLTLDAIRCNWTAIRYNSWRPRRWRIPAPAANANQNYRGFALFKSVFYPFKRLRELRRCVPNSRTAHCALLRTVSSKPPES